MQQSIGYTIRKQRREQNLTQSELGGTSFSKSYVSAVENGKLVPSAEALRHFALRLGAPENYFLALNEGIKQETSLSLQEMANVVLQGPETMTALTHEKAALLDTLLEYTEYLDLPVPEDFFTLSPEALTSFSPTRQAHYFFLQGMMFLRRADHAGAIQSFESALARETHPTHSVAILDELRGCYLRTDLPQVALSYAERAHQLVAREAAIFSAPPLPFRVELHCGETCLALGMYQQALEHFEQARIYLSSQQNMQYTGRLYRGLGYCTYALIHQQVYAGDGAADQVEYQYQRALSYLLQSYTIAQMGGDIPETRQVHLMLAMVQLDLGAWRRQILSQAEKESSTPQHLSQASLSSLLDEAAEHCRQVLVSFPKEEIQTLEQTEVAFLALALTIRVAVQRALLARSSGHESLLQRERSFAASLCQHALDACQEEALLKTLIWNAGHLPESFADSLFPALPRLPEATLPQEEEKLNSALASQAEIYWAAGEVAKMLGRTASTPDFASRSYACTDKCLLQALEMLNQVRQAYDGGYVTRAYQRYTSLLEERFHEVTDLEEGSTQVTNALLALCKKHLSCS